MHASTRRAALLPFLALAVTLACSKAEAPPAPLKVTDVEVGRAVGADRKISDKTDSFKPTDTIYVSVATEGSSPGAKLAAHWTFKDGQLVKHDETSIAPTGTAATEFHIVKPSGWPVGDYKVEVMLDGAPAGSKSFKVAK
jgi:hypothetical protein